MDSLLVLKPTKCAGKEKAHNTAFPYEKEHSLPWDGLWDRPFPTTKVKHLTQNLVCRANVS